MLLIVVMCLSIVSFSAASWKTSIADLTSCRWRWMLVCDLLVLLIMVIYSLEWTIFTLKCSLFSRSYYQLVQQRNSNIPHTAPSNLLINIHKPVILHLDYRRNLYQLVFYVILSSATTCTMQRSPIIPFNIYCATGSTCSESEWTLCYSVYL